jgi:hypothetical protein
MLLSVIVNTYLFSTLSISMFFYCYKYLANFNPSLYFIFIYAIYNL